MSNFSPKLRNRLTLNLHFKLTAGHLTNEKSEQLSALLESKMIKISVARCRVCCNVGVRNKKGCRIRTHSQKHDHSITRRSVVGLSTILLSEFLIQSETKADVP